MHIPAKKGRATRHETNNNIRPAFLVLAHAIVRKLSILVIESGSLFGFFLNAFLSPGHRTLTRAIALAFAFAMTVFRSLTFWSSSIFIWQINHLLSAGDR